MKRLFKSSRRGLQEASQSLEVQRSREALHRPCIVEPSGLEEEGRGFKALQGTEERSKRSEDYSKRQKTQP
jgi:hypothetical protein